MIWKISLLIKIIHTYNKKSRIFKLHLMKYMIYYNKALSIIIIIIIVYECKVLKILFKKDNKCICANYVSNTILNTFTYQKSLLRICSFDKFAIIYYSH